jgi:hypothetical protein
MKATADGRVFDLTDPDEAGEFLRAQARDIAREYCTPLWEKMLLVLILIVMILVVLAPVLSEIFGKS